MKNVMVRAWEIARAAVVKFGGKVKEYFAQALVMAWAEIKAATKLTERVILTANHDTKYYTVAGEINGRIVKTFENLSHEQMIEKYNYFIHNFGIKTASYYVIKGGTRKFLETKAVA
ncbi:hypothetical protein V3851_04345 [Paenibacillus sp. M1]|uniref:Phage protein n=1 Tax=Paenibacillus haidiansis TaxID=1574488 RepID=A0ABU7VMS8_9BACL